MGRRVLAGLVIALSASACDSATVATCTRIDRGSPCSLGDSAEPTEYGWWVVIRTTVRTEREYGDNGDLCGYNEVQCIEETCSITVDSGTMSASEAISRCREIQKR